MKFKINTFIRFRQLLPPNPLKKPLRPSGTSPKNRGGVALLASIFFIGTMLIISSCRKLQQEIPLNLPPFKSQLAVECYLGNPDPTECALNNLVGVQAAISNTQDYFAPVNLNSLQVKGADVTVSYDSAGKTYTFRLDENLLINNCDTSNIKLFNYKYFNYSFSLDSVKIGTTYIHYPNITTKKRMFFHTGLVYTLSIDDHNGRVATSTTQWLDTVSINSISTTFSARDTTYNLIVKWNDASYNLDYYRMQARILNMDSASVVKRGHPLKQDVTFTDAINNGGELVIGGPYRYKQGDSIEVKMFHIRKEYYDYLRTVGAAVNSLGNPFGQPATIASNVTGGLGIFTVLPWTKKIIVIK